MGTKNKPCEFDCYDDLDDDEPYFVLRAKDPLAAEVVRIWAELYWKSGRRAGTPGERKHLRAIHCALEMERWRDER